MAVQPVPEGYHTITPYLAVDDASAAIDFYKRAFGAEERARMSGPGGSVMHAELAIGDSIVMLADPFPQASTTPPKELGGTTVSIFAYVEDIDAVYKQAIDAGASSLMEPDDMFWGDRFGSVSDPFGHSWTIATHVEDVSPEEMEKRSEAFTAQMAEMASS
jgi:PhnB protein